MSQFGLTEWGSVQVKSGGQNKPSSDFLKLTNGDNYVRIVTKPHEFSIHQYKAHPDDEGFGTRILACQGKDPLVEAGLSKPKRKWIIGVIDRKTNSYKVLEISSTVFKGIQELVRDEDWGDPSQYDVNIKVDKNGGPTGYYSVIPKPKKPLTAEDLEIKQNVDLDELKRRCTPSTYEAAFEKMKAVQAKSVHFQASLGKSSMKVSVQDDEDDDFPSAN